MARALACVAPARYRLPLEDGLAAVGLRVLFLPDRDSLGRAAAMASEEADALVVVVPRNKSLRMAAPGPVIKGLPVGLLPSDSPRDLQPWLDGLLRQESGSGEWAVMAMARKSYLAGGRRFVRWLRGADPDRVRPWFADTVSQEEVCERLATGPRLAVYVGHGRGRGFSGYRGLRWRHLARVKTYSPCGTIFSLACDTLKRTHNSQPFGSQWVMSGRAAAYFGPAEAVTISGITRLGHLAGALFERDKLVTLSDLIKGLETRTSEDPDLTDARRAFEMCRLVGNPLQSFT